MGKRKADREMLRMALPALSQLIVEKRSVLDELERVHLVKLKAMRRAMKQGAQFYARDLVKDVDLFRAQTYFHPKNEGIEWTGKGRMPVWFIDALIAGDTPDTLAVQKFVKPKRQRKQVLVVHAGKSMLDAAYDEILRSANVPLPAEDRAVSRAGKAKRR